MQQWLIPAKGKKTMTKTNQTRQISRRLTCQVISYLNGSHLLLLLKSILCQSHNHSILSHQIKILKIKWLESNFRFISIVGLYPWTSWWRIKSFIIYKKMGNIDILSKNWKDFNSSVLYEKTWPLQNITLKQLNWTNFIKPWI